MICCCNNWWTGVAVEAVGGGNYSLQDKSRQRQICVSSFWSQTVRHSAKTILSTPWSQMTLFWGPQWISNGHLNELKGALKRGLEKGAFDSRGKRKLPSKLRSYSYFPHDSTFTL